MIPLVKLEEFVFEAYLTILIRSIKLSVQRKFKMSNLLSVPAVNQGVKVIWPTNVIFNQNEDTCTHSEHIKAKCMTLSLSVICVFSTQTNQLQGSLGFSCIENSSVPACVSVGAKAARTE